DFALRLFQALTNERERSKSRSRRLTDIEILGQLLPQRLRPLLARNVPTIVGSERQERAH
ncbi:MAG: hypothetical protein AAFU53_17880, partial [Cyanobacteria bacterium J06632_3]